MIVLIIGLGLTLAVRFWLLIVLLCWFAFDVLPLL